MTESFLMKLPVSKNSEDFSSHPSCFVCVCASLFSVCPFSCLITGIIWRFSLLSPVSFCPSSFLAFKWLFVIAKANLEITQSKSPFFSSLSLSLLCTASLLLTSPFSLYNKQTIKKNPQDPCQEFGSLKMVHVAAASLVLILVTLSSTSSLHGGHIHQVFTGMRHIKCCMLLVSLQSSSKSFFVCVRVCLCNVCEDSVKMWWKSLSCIYT